MEIEDIENELEIEIPICDEKPEEEEVKQEGIRTKLNFQIACAVNLIKCFWCRNSFVGEKFSIPTKYMPSHYPVPNGTAETKSFVEKEVTRMERRMMQEEGTPITLNETFELDGIFCSGECRQAYLEEHIYEPLYRDSIALLKMYDKIKYLPAMSWKQLKEYGGRFTIEEFRERNSENKTMYRENPISIGEKYLERDFI